MGTKLKIATRLPLCELTLSGNVIVNHRAGKRASRLPMTAAVGLIKTNNLSVWDHATGTSFLVDTGADVCVFPAFPNDKCKRTPTENLTAANGSEINTWGQRVITFILGQRKRYRQKFYLADVARPILGDNFFTANNIAIDLRGRRLVDLNHGHIFAAHTESTPNSRCGLVLGATSRFNQLLLQFPQILAPSLQNHPVNIHHRANVGFSAAGLGKSWKNCQRLTNNANFLPMIYF